MCSKNQLVLPLLLPSLPLSYVSSTRPFNPISSASDSYLYELELTSKRPSLGADWTKPQSFTGQFSDTNPRRCHQAEVVSAADHQATETHTDVRCRWQSSSDLTFNVENQISAHFLSSAVEYLENIVSSP